MKMKLSPLVLVAALLVPHHASAQSEGGWGKTHWGMSVSDVQREYPSAAPFRGSVTKKGDVNCRLEIGRFDIGGRNYEVRFFFDSADQLAEVNLTWIKRGDHLDGVYSELASESLRKNLTEKYGRPVLTEPGTLSHWVWTKPGLVVDLAFMPSANLVTLWYTKPNKKVLDNL